MAVLIQGSVGSSMSTATGRSMQGHALWASGQGAYWVPYLSGTNQLSALYSTDGTTWTAPSGSPYTLTQSHWSDGRNFSFAAGNIAGTDVLHMGSAYSASNGSGTCTGYHARFTLGATLTNTNAEASISSVGTYRFPSGQCSFLDSAARPIDIFCYLSGFGGYLNMARGSNADAGSSWTAGFTTAVDSLGTQSAENYFGCSLGSGNFLGIHTTGTGTTNPTFTNLEWATWNGTSWSDGGAVLASPLGAAQDPGTWGAVGLTTSDVHLVVLNNGSNAYTHRRFNGTSWSNGDAIPTLAYGTNSGISLIADGTSVWAAAIDTSKDIRYSKWTSGSGWAAWATLEAARANTPAYLTGVYSPSRNEILWMWTEANGANFDIVGSVLGTSGVVQDPIGVASNSCGTCIAMP